MSKTVTINQDKLLMLKEFVASDSNITSHNSYCSELTEAAPEVDEYEIGDEGSNPPVGGNFYHVNESTSFDSSEIGAVNYSWDFDEEEYQEWLADAEYENTQEALMEYINDNVEFELEYLDNETYHTCGRDYVDYNALEDMFGEKMQKEILTTCMSDGSGSFETVNLYSDDDVDINNQNSVNDMAMKLLRHGDYFKDCRGFILTNGVVVYTESEHNEICIIPNINNKFDFIRMGNIRVLPQSIDIGAAPTSEQRDVLRKAIASYANEELYLDIYQGKSSIGAKYIHPDWRYVMGEIDRFFSEGINPQGNEFYESKKIQITENESDNLSDYDKSILYLKISEEQLTKKMAEISNKYGCDIKFFISNANQGVIQADQNDIQKFKTFGVERRNINEKIKKIQEIIKRKEQEKKSLEDWESRKTQLENDYDVISLAIEEFGLTSTLSQAGYILPDGKLLNFGNYGARGTDHRAIEGIYKENNIPIWSDEYRYNYVVDFMNHGAIRCDVNAGILDMTQEPTNEQYSVIKSFVRKAEDVDIDFTDDKGNTLHSVSYSDAKPQQVVADIQRYYNEGIKPQGNVQYEGKKIKHANLIIESQESKSIAAAKKLVMQRLNYNEQEADEFIRIKLRNDIPTLRTPQGGKFILGATRMFCDGQLRTANDIGNLNSTLKLVASDAHINEYDRNLNGMSCQELVQRFAKAMSDNLDAEKNEIGQMTFNTPSDYEIVMIDSFEQAEEYGDYVSWCVTHDESMFNSYTSDGINQFYFCLKNDFESVVAQPSEGCPLDEYGLSMIAVSVNENGMLNTCTCRWNHDNGGDDSIMNAKEVSQVIGMNFFEVFKPNNKWKDLLTSVMQRLANGEDPRNVFDYVGYFMEGFARVELNNKCNFINQEGRLLSDQWFDYVDDFSEGFARVELNGKEYKIDTSGNLSLFESKNKNKKILISENQLEAIKENLDFEVSSSDIDLSSFKKKHELVPNIWNPDGKLNSRIRLKLLDIADDFWKFVNLTWVKPRGIILTGSICNFNWSQYSDIDLHLIVDFNEIDEKTEFVKDYLDSKKNEWNNEHENLQIMGYKVELYVQNIDETPESNGIYDLEENDWLEEPNPNDIKPIELNKFSIKDKAANIMTIIDDMYDTLASTDDSHKIEEIGDDANYLWQKIKNMRKNSLETQGESGNGNIVYKYMRRMGYLDKLWKLRTLCYDKTNSITEGIYYDKFRNDQSFRYKIIGNMIDDGYVFHGTTNDEWDSFDSDKIKGGSRGVYGYGAYFTNAAYKCEEYAANRGNYMIANINDFYFINLEETINKEKNIFIDAINEYYLAKNCLDNARNIEEYDEAESKLDEFNSIDIKLLENAVRIIGNYDGKITYRTLNNRIPMSYEDMSKEISMLYLALGFDGFICENQFVIFNFNKLNNSMVKDKESLISNYVTKIFNSLTESDNIRKYITLLKENLVNEESVADGSSNGNPYKKRWETERKALKDFICNYGTVMQSREDSKAGKLYKVFYDKAISELIGYNYALCVQWDEINLKPKSIVYIRAIDKFTPNIRRNLQYDTRGYDNIQGTYDDLSYRNY